MIIIKESNMKRPKIIAIDFDDSIAKDSFPDCSNADLIPNARELINKLYSDGYYIIIWTCRFLPEHLLAVREFLERNCIKYNSINENYPLLEFKPTPKIYYDYLVDDKCLLDVEWIWEYTKIKIQFAETDLYTLMSKMKQHFYDRTRNHILSVQTFYINYARKHADFVLASNYFIENFKKHDFIKFEQPELIPYIATTWNYYCKDNSISFSISPDLQKAMNEATEHHVKNSSHHPEFWLEDKDRPTIPINDRDKFDPNTLPIIDVSETMPFDALIEMCADWCAMSQERRNTPFEWADKVINHRWKFGEEKTAFIYKTLHEMWDK